jgi:release factor glutamine methyltransferase
MSTEQPWTIGRLLEWTTQYLAQKGIESPRLETQVLLAHALDCKRIDLYARFEELAPEEGRKQFRELIRKRLEGCPVAYLVGRKEFFALEFEVNPAVLIPRPDTECLVDDCLRLLRDRTGPRVLDVGTGSGCLAVAVAWKHKTAQVTAIDINPEALAVASRNASKHGVGDRIRFLEGDLYGPLPAEERFDLILSNPPYIRRADLATLPASVRDYEPRLALDGGADGFAVFDRLLAGAGDHLTPCGSLMVEIGSDQETEARRRVQARPGFELAPTIKDSEGRSRVLRARWQPAGSGSVQ